MGNTQSRVQPSLQAATTGVVLIASLPAAVASSANHTCLALGSASLSLSISGLTAKAYIAIANGSPWVVPSLESISPPTHNKKLDRCLVWVAKYGRYCGAYNLDVVEGSLSVYDIEGI